MGRQRRAAGDAAEDRLESEADEFHGRIRDAFLELAAARPDSYLVLPAHLPVESLAAQILGRVDSLLVAQEAESVGTAPSVGASGGGNA